MKKGAVPRTLHPQVPPGDETDSPGDLGVVEAFVNTITYQEHGPADETWTDPEALGRWLTRYGLLADGDRVEDAADLDRAIRVREALRDLLHANHDGIAPHPAALELLERESGAAALAVVFSGEGHAALRPVRGGVDGALAALLAITFHAMHDGTWERLKACRSDDCRWAFYDGSRNRSGKWCSMAVCGNREKVRAFRERLGADPPPGD